MRHVDTEQEGYPGPDMVPVESSAMTHVGYDPDRSLLRVRYSRGHEYDFSPVSPDQHRAIMGHKSKGLAVVRLGMSGRQVKK